MYTRVESRDPERRSTMTSTTTGAPSPASPLTGYASLFLIIYLLVSSMISQVGLFGSNRVKSHFKVPLIGRFDPMRRLGDPAIMLPNMTSVGPEGVGLRLKGLPLDDSRKLWYAVVFDGGSTGTRVHVLVFTCGSDETRLRLEKGYFRQVQPGLSSYASDPREAAKSILPLLQLAIDVVPPSKRSVTPLLLKATAGLRLLPEKTADAILREVDSLFREMKNPFKLEADSVSVLDGNSEGIYAWVTINFLLNRLHNPKGSVVVMDMGGGSTQVTFTPNQPETISSSPASYMIKKMVDGQEQDLYTHSYLGYGLMSARKAILLHPLVDKVSVADNEVTLTHPCFPNNSHPLTSWTFENTRFTINGTPGDCYQLAASFVSNRTGPQYSRTIDNPIELNNRIIYAISYYFDRASEVGLIEPNATKGSVRVRDYALAAQDICGKDMFTDSSNYISNDNNIYDPEMDRCFRREQNMRRKKGTIRGTASALLEANPFLCLDLSYITALLRALGLTWNKELRLVQQLNGIETSWSLGAAFDLLPFK